MSLQYIDYRTRHEKKALRFFTKKDDALMYSQKYGCLPLFSIDKTITDGSKYFVAGSYNAFWDVYSKFPRPIGELKLSSDTHLRVLPFAYEVIIEDVPVKLYLDVEGSSCSNPNFDFESKLQSLIQELKYFLYMMHVIRQDDEVSISMLDSSTSKKFSRHVIVNISDSLFANNYICGALIRNFHIHLLHKFGEIEVNPFYINPDDDAKSPVRVCMLDLSVYTKNRDFRMIGSCKRKGSSVAKQIRWLWMLELPLVLTKEIFLNSLLQSDAGKTVNRYIVRVVDTINNGIPSSSSLKTATSIVTTRKPEKKPTTTSSSSPAVSGPVMRLTSIAQSVGQWIQNSQDFRDYFKSEESNRFIATVEEYNNELTFKINFPHIHHCRARKEVTGNPVHKTNSIYFIVHISGDSFSLIQQYCASNTCRPGGAQRIAGIIPIPLAPRFWHEIDLILGPRDSLDACMFIETED